MDTKFKQTEIGEIPTVTLQKYCELIQYGYTQSASKEEIGPKFLRITDIQTKPVDWSTVPFCKIDEKDFNKYILKDGDILIARTGASTGTNTIYESKMPKSVFASYLIRIRLSSEFHSKYVHYFLQSKYYSDYIAGILGGSAQPNANAQQLTNVLINKFSLDTQKQIATILSSLDNKIELNQKTIKTLEETGQALFKRWFIDFEFPNEKGDPYKSSGGEMVDSELGEIPKGWSIEILPKIAFIQKGLSYKGENLTDGGDSVLVGLKCFNRGGGFNLNGIKYYNGNFKKEHVLNPGDLVIAMTDLTQGAEVLGKPAIIPNLNRVKNIIASLDTSILRPKDNNFSKEYLYLLFSRPETQSLLFGYSNGSTVLHLSSKGLTELPVIIPQSELLNKFNIITKSIFTKIDLNNREINTLTKTKNFLLPKLLSGKIRV